MKKQLKSKVKTKRAAAITLVEVDFVKMQTGRPSVMTDEILRKLELAWSMGADDKMACKYAGIAPSTLYLFQKKYPGFSEYKTDSKDLFYLQCLQTISTAVNTDADLALRMLKRRLPDFRDVDSANQASNTNILIQTNVTGAIATLEKLPRDKRRAIIDGIRREIREDDGSGS